MSTLKVNNLQDISGGNNSTPEQMVQGRAKAWVRFNGSGTVSIGDSFNVSSLTDNGTGNYEFALTTNMANINYVGIANSGRFASCGNSSGNYTVGTFDVIVHNINGDLEDRSVIHAVLFGDQ